MRLIRDLTSSHAVDDEVVLRFNVLQYRLGVEEPLPTVSLFGGGQRTMQQYVARVRPLQDVQEIPSKEVHWIGDILAAQKAKYRMAAIRIEDRCREPGYHGIQQWLFMNVLVVLQHFGTTTDSLQARSDSERDLQ